MTSDQDIAWLAGFMDGEGTIALNVDRNYGNVIKPLFAAANTNLENMNRLKAVMSSIVGRELRWNTAQNIKHGYRPCYQVRAARLAEVEALCRAVLPYLSGKRPHAELMLRYIAIAPGTVANGGKTDRRGSYRTRYGPEHAEFVEGFKRLNRRYRPGEWDSQRETERLAPECPGEETARPASRDAEAAEMTARP